MKFETLLTDLQDGILTITINREDKMNALNLKLLAELNEAFDTIYADDSIKGVILTGKGVKAFAAGADIAEFANFDSEEGTAMADDGHHVMNKIEASPKPVIAAVNGYALGGGCELAMACHIRIAAAHAKFGQPEVGLGIIPGYGGTQRLPQLVGRGKSMEMLMTGEAIDALTAEQTGLVNKVSPPADLMEDAREMMGKILSKAPLAIAKVIDCVAAHFDKERDGFATEIKQFGLCFDTLDFEEGTKAFLEKGKADFKGR